MSLCPHVMEEVAAAWFDLSGSALDSASRRRQWTFGYHTTRSILLKFSRSHRKSGCRNARREEIVAVARNIPPERWKVWCTVEV